MIFNYSFPHWELWQSRKRACISPSPQWRNSSWSRSMNIALQAENKFGFHDDTVPVPQDDIPPLLQSWFHNNSIVSIWILNTISNDHIPNMIYSAAAEMLYALKDKFHQPNGQHIFQLHCDLLSCTHCKLISAYFSKIFVVAVNANRTWLNL